MTRTRMAIFILVIAALSGLLHYYLWARLVALPAWPPALARVLTLTFAGFGALMPIGFVLLRELPRSFHAPVAWVVFIWMGLAFILAIALFPLDLARAIATRALSVDADRRLALARIVAATVGLLALVLGAVGLRSALARVRVERVPIRLAKLPRRLSGYTIVQLTDVHVGPTIGRTFLEEVVATVNAQDADCVVITGDLVDGSVANLGDAVSELGKLRARDGVYFVTGNHEYYSGVDSWIAFLASHNIRTLRNERVPLGGRDGEGFDLAGVDDYSTLRAGMAGHRCDPARACEGRDPNRALVMLAHQPKTLSKLRGLGVDLVLSGHTHGGQLWPWGYLVRLDQGHVSGLSREGDTQMYVSRGTGYWGPPMRVGAPAEITRIELLAGDA